MELFFLLFGELQEIIDDFLKFFFKLIFRVLETVDEEFFVFSVDLGNDVVSEMFDFVISHKKFKNLKSMEVKLFILFDTIIGNDLEIKVSHMINDTASFDKIGNYLIKDP